MSTSKIRGFLLQLPKPSRIRVSSGDAEPQEIKPARSAARTAESIQALGAELIECLDKDGALLRALRLGDGESHRSDAAEIPDGIKADPHALMITHFANLLHRAYEHSTEIAFTRLVELAERYSSHSESVTARLERTEALLRRERDDRLEDWFEHARDVAEKAGTESSGNPLLDQMLGAFLQAKASHVPPPGKANGKSNGKG